MNEQRIAFDPCNPGQFYACCGLIELFELAGSETYSHFEVDWRRPRAAEFVLESSSVLKPASIANLLRDSVYKAMPRPGDGDPTKDAIAPVQVSLLGRDYVLDWWLDEFHDSATPWKCWAGQLTTTKLFGTLPRLIEEISFDAAVFSSTRLGIDPRSAWVAVDLGYSANEQGHEARTFPAVEMLAAFGLQGHRPRGSRREGFSYVLWQDPLPAIVTRLACNDGWDGLRKSDYRFNVEKRGSYKYFSFAQFSDSMQE